MTMTPDRLQEIKEAALHLPCGMLHECLDEIAKLEAEVRHGGWCEAHLPTEQLPVCLACEVVHLDAEVQQQIGWSSKVEAESMAKDEEIQRLRAVLLQYADHVNWETFNGSLAPHSFWSKDWYKNHHYDCRPWNIAEEALRPTRERK